MSEQGETSAPTALALGVEVALAMLVLGALGWAVGRVFGFEGTRVWALHGWAAGLGPLLVARRHRQALRAAPRWRLVGAAAWTVATLWMTGSAVVAWMLVTGPYPDGLEAAYLRGAVGVAIFMGVPVVFGVTLLVLWGTPRGRTWREVWHRAREAREAAARQG